MVHTKAGLLYHMQILKILHVDGHDYKTKDFEKEYKLKFCLHTYYCMF